MSERAFNPTYIKQWRLKRGLSLRKLADRMETEPGGELLISHASLSRIESGDQPYSQPILEALAAALDCTAADLISVNPEKEGDVIDLLRHLPPEKHQQAVEFLRFLATGTKG